MLPSDLSAASPLGGEGGEGGEGGGEPGVSKILRVDGDVPAAVIPGDDLPEGEVQATESVIVSIDSVKFHWHDGTNPRVTSADFAVSGDPGNPVTINITSPNPTGAPAQWTDANCDIKIVGTMDGAQKGGYTGSLTF